MLPVTERHWTRQVRNFLPSLFGIMTIARRDKNRAEKIAELNENSIEDTERDISMEAHERKKQRDKKRYANDTESKKSYEKARRLENRMPEPIREAHERKKQRDKKRYA
ncbi:hypothetical protein EMCRGX_G026115 [Ephydatia muelleri]